MKTLELEDAIVKQGIYLQKHFQNRKGLFALWLFYLVAYFAIQGYLVYKVFMQVGLSLI